jgi:hypothetical protein
MTYLVVLVIGAMILIDGDLIVPAFKNYIKRVVWRKYEKELEDIARYIYEQEKARKRLGQVLNMEYAQYVEYGYKNQPTCKEACDRLHYFLNIGTPENPAWINPHGRPKTKKPTPQPMKVKIVNKK